VTEERREEWVNAPQQARSQETLDRFLEATEELLREKNFDEITIADIVARADRTVGSFYARFDDKVAVVKTLTSRRVEAMRFLGDEILTPQVWTRYPVRQLIETSMNSLCELYRSSGHVFSAAVTMASNDAEGRQQRNHLHDYLADRMHAVLVAHPDVDARSMSRIALAAEVVGAVIDARLIFRWPDATCTAEEYWRATAHDLTHLFMNVAELDSASEMDSVSESDRAS
jgi:AcrR family transcriptional regulator